MRRLLLLLGLLTLAAVWLGPLADAARRAFSAHMLMHMGVVAVAAPLLALGVTGGRFDPVVKMPRLFAAIPASVLELVVVWTWHAPALHHAARYSTIGSIAEQGMFLISALLLWLSAYGGNDRHGARRAASPLCACGRIRRAYAARGPRPWRGDYAPHGGHILPPRRSWADGRITEKETGGNKQGRPKSFRSQP